PPSRCAGKSGGRVGVLTGSSVRSRSIPSVQASWSARGSVTRVDVGRIEGEADPLLVVTDGAPGLIAGADPRRNGDDYPMTSRSDGLGPQKRSEERRVGDEGRGRRPHEPQSRRRYATAVATVAERERRRTGGQTRTAQ